MEYEDAITIPTPEGLELQYPLAGGGSRFAAELIDVLLRLVALGVLFGVLAALGVGSGGTIVLIVASFLAWFAYDIVFEVWGAGRTPAKRWSGLRVVMAAGQPVGVGSSAVRTLLRLIDQWLTLGIVGMVAIQFTSRNQRLGDLAAGTIVVRERTSLAAQPAAVAVGPGLADVDVTAITATELAAVRDFLARRDSLTNDARSRVAQALSERLAGKVGGLPPGGLPPERLLETIVAAKSRSGERPVSS